MKESSGSVFVHLKVMELFKSDYGNNSGYYEDDGRPKNSNMQRTNADECKKSKSAYCLEL